MPNDDLLELTITELAPKIRAKEVSPVEVTEAALARADRLGVVKEPVNVAPRLRPWRGRSRRPFQQGWWSPRLQGLLGQEMVELVESVG